MHKSRSGGLVGWTPDGLGYIGQTVIIEMNSNNLPIATNWGQKNIKWDSVIQAWRGGNPFGFLWNKNDHGN